MTLYMDKRGCNFWKDDPIREKSDIGNYRVTTGDYNVTGTNGRVYFMEFIHIDTVYRFNRKDGKGELKKPVREKLETPLLRVDCEFQNERGTWGDITTEKRINAANYPYTIAGILSAVNSISAVKYDNLVFTSNADRR